MIELTGHYQSIVVVGLQEIYLDLTLDLYQTVQESHLDRNVVVADLCLTVQEAVIVDLSLAVHIVEIGLHHAAKEAVDLCLAVQENPLDLNAAVVGLGHMTQDAFRLDPNIAVVILPHTV